MDRRLKVELFEVIRRGYAAGETIQGLSRKHGVHRRMVRQALGNAIPPERKAVIREAPRLGPVKELIDGMLAVEFRRRASSVTRLIGSGCDYAASIGSSRRRSDSTALCAAAEARAGAQRTGSVRAAEL